MSCVIDISCQARGRDPDGRIAPKIATLLRYPRRIRHEAKVLISALRSTAILLVVALLAASCASVAAADPPRRDAAARASARAHARPTAAQAHPDDDRLPQDCAMDPFHADYGGLERGARVRLGQHREVDGDAFWADEMQRFVGRVTTVVGPRGVDEKGCPLIAVAVDDGEFDWRVRDLERVASDASDALSLVTLSPGFAGDPRTFEGTIETDEAFDRRSGQCTGLGGHAATMRLTLDEDFESIVFLAHADVDLVLMVRTPTGEVICADDVDDLDPVIGGSAASGVYEIWVGAYDDAAAGSTFRLGISEKEHVRSTDLVSMNATRIGAPDETRSNPENEP